MNGFMTTANKFANIYKSMLPNANHNQRRRVHEMRCFQRWYILYEYMKIRGVEKAVFGDGDSSIYVSAEALWAQRPQCQAVINIETQAHNYHWVGAGESSMWTLGGIADFCNFMDNVYSKDSYVNILQAKYKSGSNVVDMSLLWLWWVAHRDAVGWEAGRPWLAEDPHLDEAGRKRVQDTSDNAFKFSKALAIPGVDKSVTLCNGMDVVNRTVFDHMNGWQQGTDFRFGFATDGPTGVLPGEPPSVVGPCGRMGGRPESLEPAIVQELARSRLYLNNIHYQGGMKDYIHYDVCRLLLLTGDRFIEDPSVSKICSEEHRNNPKLPCRKHKTYAERDTVCI